MRLRTVRKVFLMVVLLFLVLWASLFVLLFHGWPIHNFRLWLVEWQFAHAGIDHPTESILLGRSSYLGGPKSGHICVYGVGEVRRSQLHKDEITRYYEDIFVGRKPLKIYFTDESDLPYDISFSDWQSEVGVTPFTDESIYIVFIENKGPSLFDPRCDG